jgi:hypothetical protein
MEIVLQIASYITAVGVIIKAVESIFDKKTKMIRTEVENTNKKIDNNEKDDLRYKILSFANSLHNGDNHTRQEYETIFMFYDKYEVIISELEIKNGYLETEMSFIRKTYEVKYMEVKYEKDV